MSNAPEAYVLVVGHKNDAQPLLDAGTFGPFDSVGEAQEFARKYRFDNDIPGHANALPTPEECEAWTAAGWTFCIFPLTKNYQGRKP